MRNLTYSTQKRNKVSFLLVSAFLFGSIFCTAQAPPPVYGRLIMYKVEPGNQQEFEKFMKEIMKPIHTLRRSKGTLVHWILFKVHFTGGNDEYNYVAVNYHPTWASTEANEAWPDLSKQANPKADPVAIFKKLQELGTIVRQPIFYRSHAIEPAAPVQSKYVRLDYMKIKPGRSADYLKVETEDWMPFHQTLVSAGESTGWGLWRMVFPAGSDSPYDYVTSNRYSTYGHVMATDYEKTFKKASPSKNTADIFARTTESRDLVKSELWEALVMLDALAAQGQ